MNTQGKRYFLRLSASLLIGLFVSATTSAEQFKQIGDYQVHYIVIPTTFVTPEIAQTYGLARGKNRALVNLSILDENGRAVAATVSGESQNLLGQPQTLVFNEVREQQAIYYLAQLRHADEEHHRIRLSVTLPGGEVGEIAFRQKMYWER